jgi:hypothetical protein
MHFDIVMHLLLRQQHLLGLLASRTTGSRHLAYHLQHLPTPITGERKQHGRVTGCSWRNVQTVLSCCL